LVDQRGGSTLLLLSPGMIGSALAYAIHLCITLAALDASVRTATAESG